MGLPTDHAEIYAHDFIKKIFQVCADVRVGRIHCCLRHIAAPDC